MMKLRWNLIACVILLNSCQVGPRYSCPETAAPQSWRHQSCETIPSLPPLDHWWEVFGDEKLVELETCATSGNLDLYAAVERVRQARALAGSAFSISCPQINFEPYAETKDILYMKFDPTRIVREHRRRNSVPFVVNYELDLWGKLYSGYESALFNAEAEWQALQTALLMLTTDVASAYFQLRAIDTDLEILENTVKARKKAYDIVKARYDAHITNYSDVSRADLEYTNTQAEYFDAKRRRNLHEHQIATLLGIPANDFCLPFMPLKTPPPEIPAGVPSDVLLRRPDIAEAERRMATEHRLINVAYASFFPSISLTAFFGFSSPELKDFLSWKSRLYGAAVDALQPLFDGGLLCSNLQLAMASFREADDLYRQTVLEAFQEVEDALANLEGYGNEYQSIEQSTHSAHTTYQVASDRYEAGVTFYLDVVDSERQELDAQRHLADLLGKRYIATVDLIKALGGDWD